MLMPRKIYRLCFNCTVLTDICRSFLRVSKVTEKKNSFEANSRYNNVGRRVLRQNYNFVPRGTVGVFLHFKQSFPKHAKTPTKFVAIRVVSRNYKTILPATT
jgi:hypothetical protein